MLVLYNVQMTGHLKVVVSIAQNQNPNIIHTRCLIHREALVAKALGPEQKFALGMVVRIVDYIKMRPHKSRQFAKLGEGMETVQYTSIQHTEMQWLSRGKVLSRFHEIRKELLIFCLQESLKDFVECLSDDCWCSMLAYFADIFQELNLLNSGMQGRNDNTPSATDKINAFRRN